MSERVLIVEDCLSLSEQLLNYLELVGLKADVVESLSCAIQALEKVAYGLIVLDLELPDSSGVQTLERLLAHSNGSKIVIYSGGVDQGTQRLADIHKIVVQVKGQVAAQQLVALIGKTLKSPKATRALARLQTKLAVSIRGLEQTN